MNKILDESAHGDMRARGAGRDRAGAGFRLRQVRRLHAEGEADRRHPVREALHPHPRVGGADRRQGRDRLVQEPLRARPRDQAGHRLGLDQLVRRLEPHQLRAAVRRSLYRPEGADPAERTRQVRAGTLASAEVDGRLVQLPRVTDVSNLYYQQVPLRRTPTNQAEVQGEVRQRPGAARRPSTSSSSRSIFFANAAESLRHRLRRQGRGHDRPLHGDPARQWRRHVRRELEADLQLAKPASPPLQWFIDIYNAKAVPAGTVNYTWDDIGQAMAAGTARRSTSTGRAGPASSTTRRRPRSPAISASPWRRSAPPASAAAGRARTRSRSPKPATTSRRPSRSSVFLTNDESEMMEAQAGNLPTRTKTFADGQGLVQDQRQRRTWPRCSRTWEQSLGRSPHAAADRAVDRGVERDLAGSCRPRSSARRRAQEALDEAAAEATAIMQDAGLLK